MEKVRDASGGSVDCRNWRIIGNSPTCRRPAAARVFRMHFVASYSCVVDVSELCEGAAVISGQIVYEIEGSFGS